MAIRSTFYQRSRVLESSELLDTDRRCPICLDERAREIVQVIQDAPRVELLQCCACGGCSAARMPTSQALRDYYARYYNGSAVQGTFADVDKLADRVLSRMEASRLPERVRILDFGGGEGLLAQRIASRLRGSRQRAFAEIVLVDLQQVQPRHGEAFSQVQVESLESARGTFQIVLASAILEHIPAVHDILAGLFERVAAPGFFYARTPYIAPFLRLYKGIDLTYPGHVHDMGDRFWNRICATFDLQGARILSSTPSPVETSFRQSPLRTLLAHAFKLPAHIEGLLRGKSGGDRIWTLVGGWEVVLAFDPPA